MKQDYENEIKHLEKENNRLNKLIDKFYKPIDNLKAGFNLPSYILFIKKSV